MRIATVLIALLILVGGMGYLVSHQSSRVAEKGDLLEGVSAEYWLKLRRKSNIEYLYRGTPGDESHSQLVKKFAVKSGIPGERPTPLPKLVGRKYWLIIAKHKVEDNPETEPYFLTLNIPAPSEAPYGPKPYMECNGQCDWVTNGEFGLHGVASDESKLSQDDPGSSGCVRHADADITYLYKLLDPAKHNVRYYVDDI